MSELLRRFVLPPSPGQTAVIDARGAHTYDALVRGAFAVREGLAAVTPGERVAVLVHPGVEFLAAFFGVLLAGGSVIVLSPLHPIPETRYFCRDAGVRRVLCSQPLAEQAAALRAAEPDLLLLEVEPLLAASTTAVPEAPRSAADAIDEAAPALLLYTSGTTGRPKGAVLSHRNIGIQQALVGEAWGFSPRDTLLHALPLHHMHGLAIALLTAVGAGATVRMRAFDAAALWDEMRDATVFMAVPAMYHRLLVAFDAAAAATKERWTAHARALRLATSGSAALPVTLAERWQTLTGTIPLERFGMTEIGVGITNSLAGRRFAGSVGLPLPTVETRIVGDAGDESELGELWIRGPSVFGGYHERAEETARAFVADPDGAWFKTGDTVTRDESLPGRPFRILGRTSVDILKSGGYKLSALEIEEVLREHAEVAEVAVVGVADEAWGDRVVACVIRRDPSDAPCDEATLRAFVRERLAPYKVPKEIRFVAELPKNALGKVVKPELVRRLTAEA
jgi:malonyl-CoA/methylmalonyl-CoA synthetase